MFERGGSDNFNQYSFNKGNSAIDCKYGSYVRHDLDWRPTGKGILDNCSDMNRESQPDRFDNKGYSVGAYDSNLCKI